MCYDVAAPNDHGTERVNQAVKRSLANLRLTYVDLYLVHWPGVSGVRVESATNATVRASTWAALVNLHRQGLLRAIGVSNYTARHINELLANSCGVKPAVNQVCTPVYRNACFNVKVNLKKGVLFPRKKICVRKANIYCSTFVT